MKIKFRNQLHDVKFMFIVHKDIIKVFDIHGKSRLSEIRRRDLGITNNVSDWYFVITKDNLIIHRTLNKVNEWTELDDYGDLMINYIKHNYGSTYYHCKV